MKNNACILIAKNSARILKKGGKKLGVLMGISAIGAAGLTASQLIFKSSNSSTNELAKEIGKDLFNNLMD